MKPTRPALPESGARFSYRVTVAVTEVNETDGKTVATGQVSGTFPGSPLQLHYTFTLDGEKIARLEILS